MGAGAPSVSIGRLRPSDASMPTPSASIPPMRALAIVHQPDAGPGVFADEMRDRGRGARRVDCSPERGTGPPREIADYDAVLTFGGAMHADQEDRHPWLRFEKDFLAAMLDDGMPILAVCLGSPAAGRGRRADRRAGRASRRSAGSRSR